MKLRFPLAFAFLAFFAGSNAYAQDATTTEWPRIYINPGHGSWGPDNRHMATIGHNPISSENPDTTDFYESNTNIRKGLALLEKLIEYGVPFDRTLNQTNTNPNRVGAALDLKQTNIVMSHVKCGPYPYATVNGVSPNKENDFNRKLSEIASEVETNNFDMFISIHSNATTNDATTTNYLAYFYRTDYGADANTCIAMSEASWNHRILDRHTQWSNYDFLLPSSNYHPVLTTTAYGVLKHSVPGYLVEGYFHTYQPARHRYMNFDMCRLEGVDYARGVADYFGWEKESTGDICGVVRDAHEKFTDALYTPKASTNDIFKPLNGVIVTLKKDGSIVKTDTTDVNYNGLYTFRDLTPGTYTIEFSHRDYEPWVISESNGTKLLSNETPTSIQVTVEKAKTIYPTAFIQSKDLDANSIPDPAKGARVYAYKLRQTTEDTDVTVSFNTNVMAKSANIILTADGETDIIIPATSNDKRHWTATITPSEKFSPNVIYNWKAEVSADAITSATCVYTKGFYRPYTIKVDNNPESDYFGNIYLTENYSTGGSHGTVNALYSSDATLSDVTPHVVSDVVGESERGTLPYAMAIADDGQIYVSACASSTQGVYKIDPAKFNATQFISGGKVYGLGFHNDNLFYVTDSYKFNSITTAGVAGNSFNASITNYDTYPHHAIEPIEQGIWVHFSNQAGTDGNQLHFTDYSGNIKWSIGSSNAVATDRGGMAVDENRNLVAYYSKTEGVIYYPYSFDTNNLISVGTKSTIANSIFSVTSSTGTRVEAMAFDYAGNLYVVSSGGEWLKAIALPTTNNTCTTPAKSNMTISFSKDIISGVKEISIEDANAPVEYYNLQGVKVANPSNGIFIKKQGSKATKIVL